MLQKGVKKSIEEKVKERKELFLKIFEKKACNVSSTCKAMGITRQTYYRWLEDEDFKTEVENVRESIIDMAETKLLSHINDGDVTSLIFFLKTKGKKRGYIERMEAEVKPVEEFEDKIQVYLPDNERD